MWTWELITSSPLDCDLLLENCTLSFWKKTRSLTRTWGLTFMGSWVDLDAHRKALSAIVTCLVELWGGSNLNESDGLATIIVDPSSISGCCFSSGSFTGISHPLAASTFTHLFISGRKIHFSVDMHWPIYGDEYTRPSAILIRSFTIWLLYCYSHLVIGQCVFYEKEMNELYYQTLCKEILKIKLNHIILYWFLL